MEECEFIVVALTFSDEITCHDLLEQLVWSISLIQVNDEFFVYKQCISTERTTLKESIKPISENLDILIKQYKINTSHNCLQLFKLQAKPERHPETEWKYNYSWFCWEV